jgi:geranylgeranyl diphosphate synthase type I
MSIDVYQERYLPLLEAELRNVLVGHHDSLARFYGMMRYHMGWLDADLKPIQASGGKRLRPLLCLLACEAVGGQIERALPAAAAIELLHNFSLIHDDIEDVSATRRHQLTVWKLWGMAHGINCGDGMFAAALLSLAHLCDRGAPVERALDAQRIFVETCLRLTEGQYLDMTFETQMGIDLDDYLQMIGGKTAALIACSARLGALLGGASDQAIEAYAAFGQNLGLAFQVIDDILGIWGREDETGKSARTDILTRKKTLPIVYVLQDADLRALYAQETLADRDVDRVLTILGRHQAQAFAEKKAREYSELALHNLDRADNGSPAHRALRDYALALLSRSF